MTAGEAKIIEIIAKQMRVGVADVVPENHLVDDLECDSLDLVTIFYQLDDAFGISIDDDAAENCKTVADIFALVKSTRGFQ